jgi:outer membrane protein
MNRYTALGCLGLGLMVSPMLSGMATGAVPANTKVAVIDIERTLYETPAGKRANEAFEKLRKGKQADLDSKQKGLQKNAAELMKQKAVLKPEMFESKKTELEKQLVELEQTYKKLEQSLAEERTKLVSELLKKAGPIVTELAKAEGVSLIVDQSAVVWADPAVDLTAALNAKMK